MKNSLLEIQTTDKDIVKIIESMENKSLVDDISPIELLNIAMDLYIFGNSEEHKAAPDTPKEKFQKKEEPKAKKDVKKPETKPLEEKKKEKPAEKKIFIPIKPKVALKEMPKISRTIKPITIKKAPPIAKPAEVKPAAKDNEPEKAQLVPVVAKAEPKTAGEAPKQQSATVVPESQKALKTDKPAVSAEPVKADKPVTPAKAASPEKAEKTDKPTVSTEPVKADKPVAPAKTATPVKAEKVDKPAVLAEPVKADKPVVDAKAATPSKPVKTGENGTGVKSDIAPKGKAVKTIKKIKKIKKIVKKTVAKKKDQPEKTDETKKEVLKAAEAPRKPEPKDAVKPDAPVTAKEAVKKEDDMVSFALGLFSSTGDVDVSAPINELAEKAKEKPVSPAIPGTPAEAGTDEMSVLDSIMNPDPPGFDETGIFHAQQETDLIDALMNPPPPMLETEEKAKATSPASVAVKAEAVSQMGPAILSPIEEMLAAAEAQSGKYETTVAEPTKVSKESLGVKQPAAPKKKKANEGFMSADDWMAIIEGGPVPSPPQSQDSAAIVEEPIATTLEKVTPVPPPEAAFTAPPAPAAPAAEEYISPDDWMDMMEGKQSKQSSSVFDTVIDEDEPASPELGYSLKDAPDYTIKHELPERQEYKIKEKTPTRDGMRKKEMFYQTKVSFKSRFGSSTKKPGKICSFCGKGDKAYECVGCGNPEATFMTRVCDKCAGDKKVYNKCIACGRPNAKVIARLCENCRTMARTCIICGKKV